MELISKSYYYFLVYWTLDLICSLIDTFLQEKVYRNIKNNKNLNDYLNLLTLNISDLLAGILVLITNYRMKSKKKKK